MASWKRFYLQVSVRESGRRAVEVAGSIAITEEYPGQLRSSAIPRSISVLPHFRSTQTGLASDLASPPREWLGAIQRAVRDGQLLHVHLVADGGPIWQRRLFQLPLVSWLRALPPAVVSYGRGPVPKQRGALSLPLQLSPQDTSFLRERIDPFVRDVEGRGWREVPRGGHIVHVGTAEFAALVEKRTRLVIVERNPDRQPVEFPARGGASLLQIASDPGTRIAFARHFYRAILHDAPLDAAIWSAMRDASVPTSAITLDLFEADEHSLRLREALYGLADKLNRIAVGSPRLDPRPLTARSAKLEMAGVIRKNLIATSNDLAMASSAVRGTAETLEFDSEMHAVARVHDAFSAAQPPIHRHAVSAAALESTTDVAARPRTASLWLTEQDSDVEIPPAIELDKTVSLHFVIDSKTRAHAAKAEMSERLLRQYFKDRDTLDLDIVLYSDPAKLELGRQEFRRVVLRRAGPSDEVITTCTAKAMGSHQIRACIHFHGHLVQTVVMQVGVGMAGTGAEVDYSGMKNFVGLEKLPETSYCLFVNDTGGDHWIGFYSPDENGTLGSLQTADLAIADGRTFDDAAADIRTTLRRAEGFDAKTTDGAYRFKTPPRDANEVAARATLIVDIARAGRDMYDTVFRGAAERQNTQDALRNFKESIAKCDRVISIARLDHESSMPWAATYDLPIDTADPKLRLCSKFCDTDPATTRPYAETPAACSARGDCPQTAKFDRSVVCPFGFWGFRHQIELRLRPRNSQQAAIDRSRIETDASPKAFAAVFDFQGITTPHIQHLADKLALLASTSDRAQVIDGIAKGEASLYYFFCHGEEADKRVFLKLAEPTQVTRAAQLIGSGSILTGDEAQGLAWNVSGWKKISPLVFINACQSIQLDASRVSPFLDKFVALGASGMIGTEVPVFTSLATAIGEQILELMLARPKPASLGEALLRVRRTMLGAGNPMGLVYSVFGSAALHFHAPICGRCT